MRRVAHRFIPYVRAARSFSVFRHLQITRRAERMQKIRIAVERGIGPRIRKSLFQCPGRIGISVPPDGVISLVRVADRAV